MAVIPSPAQGQPVPEGASSWPYELPILSSDNLGLKSDYVKILQDHLVSLGFNPGNIDGILGPQTIDAVKMFQVVRGLKPTGIVDRQLWLEIYRTLGEMASEYNDTGTEETILIDRGTRNLVVFVKGRFYKQYKVAVGTFRTPTPLGEFRVVHKSSGWGSGFGTRWLGLNVPWGIYGIHGTNRPDSIGTYASHGCIRMYNQSVNELYSMVKVGTRVVILDTRLPWPPPIGVQSLRPGSASQEVVFLQLRLKQAGIPLIADGRYGPMTAWGVRYFQAINCLPPTGTADRVTCQKLNSISPDR